MSWFTKLFSAGAQATIGTTLQGIDKLSTSAEERSALRVKALDTLVGAQAKAIVAEAQGKGLASQWRPILMLTFGGILVWSVVAATFGYPVPVVQLDQNLWDLMKLGIGGYVGGRSVEKIVSTIAGKKGME